MTAQPPVIDVSGLVEGDAASLERVARALPEPCAEWGAFHISGHGISHDELQRFEAAMHRLFALPREARLRLRRTRDNARGYYDEELTKNRPDWKQVFDYGAERAAGSAQADHSDGTNQWPAELPELQGVLLGFYESCERVGLSLLRALCVSLGLPPSRLDSAFADHSSFVRLNYYPECAKAAPPDAGFFPKEGALGVHHHTDAGGLTLVYQDEAAGLQVWCRDAFHLVEPVPGALTVNLADMLQVWSNDRYRSPLHRVFVRDSGERYSAPFFLNPSYETVCAPLPELLAKGATARYRPISWSHFRDRRSAGDYADYGSEIQIADFRIDS